MAHRFSTLITSAACALALAVVANAETASDGHGGAKVAATSDGHSKGGSRVFGVGAPAGDSTHAATTPKTGSHAAPAHGSKSSHGASWSYGGETGPGHWGDLKTEYGLCKHGTMQSPIDITRAQKAGLQKIEFDYRIVPLTILNNGHTVQVNVGNGSRIKIGGKSYKLLQFHFHTPSEHVVQGQSFPLEMHLVHRSADGELAVVGVFMRAGKMNFALNEVWRHLPGQVADPATIQDVAINPRDFLPNNQTYYRYMGSLTTPPCSEGVNWHVMTTPIEVGADQIHAIAKIMGGNARPPQRVGHRLLMVGE